MEYGELVYACALSKIFNYQCNKGKSLIDNFPVPSSIFSLSLKELREIFGACSHYPDDIKDSSVLEQSALEVEWAQSHGVNLLFVGDSTGYPVRLKECNDAPILLFYRGNANLNNSRIISVVGTRKATSYGKERCRKIISDFALLDEKPLVVSGLAYGIDVCAHTAALECGLETVGVMATGLDEIYPQLHRDVAAKMVGRGGVLSDFSRFSPPVRMNFIRRNRIIAGISDATLLIESDIDGGGVITSKMAYSYNRDVFAIPGKSTDKYSSGCNVLIKDNIASLICDGGDIIKSLGWDNKGGKCRNPQKVLLFESDSEIKRNILVALTSHSVLDIDSVLGLVKADYRDILYNITELELEDRIKSDGNGHYRLV